MRQLARIMFLPAVATVVAALFLGAAAPPSAGEKVTGVKAFFREGQTFITWRELGSLQGESYRVYQAQRKITPANLKSAKLLATISEGSCVFRRELRKKFLQARTGIKGYGQRFCIADNLNNDPDRMLPVGTGLFVNTAHKAGRLFYAIVPLVAGRERPGLMAALDTAIDEKVMLPGAVLQWKHPNGTAAVYTHWMDHSKWDPFNEGYAYNFGLAVPDKYDGKAPLPVMYYGHGMGGGYRCADKASYWRCLWIWHGDASGSWFFGVMNRDKTKVINYAEQRIRWSWKWLNAGRPNQFFKIDPRHVQAHGHSMGGTMCTALALRMGDIFCSTVSSAGATIHRRNRVWVTQASRLWGPVATNLPTQDGTGVWDHQDYAQWSLKHIQQETAFLLISNGKRDGSVVFEPFPDFVDALQKSKRPFAAAWNQRGHSWSAYSTRNEGMGRYRLPIDESLPAFANASNNGDPRTDRSGTVNGNLEWSASGNDFARGNKADDILDTKREYGINIRSLTGPATVDVTPRRLQKFKVAPGEKYQWENFDFSDPANPKTIAKGTVVADRYGLITVEKFAAGKAGLGNRLVLRPAK